MKLSIDFASKKIKINRCLASLLSEPNQATEQKKRTLYGHKTGKS